jgi:hypothetical protein
MDDVTVLCGGFENAVVKKDDEILLLNYACGGLFAIFSDSLDKQIKKIKAGDIELSVFDEVGNSFVITSKDGLIIYFLPVSKGGQVFFAEGNLQQALVYKTMRIVQVDGKIIPYRCAFDDQFLHSAKSCPFTSEKEDVTLLVPFDVVVTTNFTCIRVKPTNASSCIIRINFFLDDQMLDGRPTRQPFISDEWQLAYDQGIINMTTRNNMLYLLTHTCIIECWLFDYNPIPIFLKLPKDRLNLEFKNHSYRNFVTAYRKFMMDVISFKKSTVEKDPSPTEFEFPKEWEVCFKQQENAQLLISFFQKNRPILFEAITSVLTFSTVPCENEIVMNAISTFSDLSPSATCPWRKVIVTTDAIYLDSVDGIWVQSKIDWYQLQAKKTNLPICASNIQGSSNAIYVQTSPESNWTSYIKDGTELSMPLTTDNILAVYTGVSPLNLLVSTNGATNW